jgi:hypothetical protein
MFDYYRRRSSHRTKPTTQRGNLVSDYLSTRRRRLLSEVPPLYDGSANTSILYWSLEVLSQWILYLLSTLTMANPNGSRVEPQITTSASFLFHTRKLSIDTHHTPCRPRRFTPLVRNGGGGLNQKVGVIYIGGAVSHFPIIVRPTKTAD